MNKEKAKAAFEKWWWEKFPDRKVNEATEHYKHCFNDVYLAGALWVWGEQIDMEEWYKSDIEKLQAELSQLQDKLDLCQKQLKSSKEREGKLRELISSLEVCGTDECPSCVKKKGRCQVGSDYPRGLLYIQPCLQCLKEIDRARSGKK